MRAAELEAELVVDLDDETLATVVDRHGSPWARKMRFYLNLFVYDNFEEYLDTYILRYYVELITNEITRNLQYSEKARYPTRTFSLFKGHDKWQMTHLTASSSNW